MTIDASNGDQARVEQQLLEEVVDRFEQSCKEGHRLSISSFCPADFPDRPALLLELALIDIEYRLKSGGVSVLDDYLDQFPELHQSNEAVLKLLAAERRWLVKPDQSPFAPDWGQGPEQVHATVPAPTCSDRTDAGAENVGSSGTLEDRPEPLEGFVAAGPSTHVATTTRLADSAGGDLASRPGVAQAKPPVTLLGRFRVLEPLGKGACGTVYRAIDLELGRLVALKIPHTDSISTDEARERLLREARSAAQLHHPGIVPVYEVNSRGSVPFIVSALIEGQTLEESLKADEWCIKKSAQVVAKLADALQYAHDRQVVHRDVKPSNVMVDRQGIPMLMDFGLAKGDLDVSQTCDGQLVGTPAYMSPEQAIGKGGRADARSDIYSLGVVLYELLTGKRPFDGDVRALIHQVSSQEPRPPMALDRRIPRDLNTICLKCLQKPPQARYQSATSLSEDLGRFLRGEPVVARPVSWTEKGWRRIRKRPWTASLIATAVGLLILLVAVSTRLDLARRQTREVSARATQSDETAQRATQESLDQLERLFVNKGNTAIEDGTVSEALPWFVKARELRNHNGRNDRIHHARLATSLARLPRLDRLWVQGGSVSHVCQSPDGRLIAIATSDSAAVICRLDGGGPPRSLPHDGSVLYCTFDSTGERLATVSHDTKVRLWSAQDEKVAPIDLRHPVIPSCAAFRPYSLEIATGARDGRVRIWDSTTGKLLTPTLRHPRAIKHLTFNALGTMLASASDDGSVRIWDMTKLTQETVMLPHADAIKQVQFSADGQHLATGGTDGKARIWDVATQACLLELPHESEISRLVFSHSGKELVVGCVNGVVQVWNSKTGEKMRALEGHRRLISSLSLSGDDKLLATASEDATARLWDLTTGQLLHAPIAHQSEVSVADLSEDGATLITGGYDCMVRRWKVTPQYKYEQRTSLSGNVHNIEFSSGQQRILLTDDNGTLDLLGVAPQIPKAGTTVTERRVVRAAISPDGPWLATARDDGTVQIINPTTGEVSPSRPRTAGSLAAMRFVPMAGLLLTAGADGNAQLWKVTADVAPVVLHHGEPLTNVDVSADGRVIVTIANDQSVKSWDAASGRLQTDTRGIVRGANQWRISPNGRQILLSHGIQLDLRELSTGAPVRTFTHQANILHAVFSPDGSQVAATSTSNSARVWNTATGTPATGFLGHQDDVTFCEFSAKGDLLATASKDGTVRIWDAHTGEPASPYLPHTNRVAFVVFQPDGSELISVTIDGHMRVWDLGDRHATAEQLARLARLYSGLEVDSTGSAVPVSCHKLEQDWAIRERELLLRPARD